MKSHTSVRKPSLAQTNVRKNSSNELSVGDTLRKAKKDLFFQRCLGGIFLVLLVIAIVLAFYYGYVETFIDYIISLMG